MTTLHRGLTALVCTLLLSTPLVSQAQLGAPAGAGAGPAPDLSCTGRGADGKMSCGDIGLEETMDFCDDVDGDYVCDNKDECPDTPEGVPVFMNGCHEMELSADRPWVLRGVNFEFDKAVLRSESIPILDAAVNVLNEHPELLVSIDGHTDSKGSDAYNQNLSFNRANTVHDYFIDKGVNAERLVFRGFGESRPVAPNENPDGTDNPEGRFENRRVELNVLDLEAFNQAKVEVAEAKAEREAEKARREAARARAAAERAEREAEAAEEAAEEEMEQAEEEAESESSSFDESDYLNFTTDSDAGSEADSSASDEASSEPASEAAAEEEEESTSSSSASESSDSSSSESSSSDSSGSDFDESEYLDFLETYDDSGSQ